MTEAKTATRNTNMELLRAIAMSMVLVLHALLQSGALNYLSGVHYWVYWSLEAACICAVNLFVLISGYYQVNTTFKMKNVVKTAILGVWLYSVVFSGLQIVISAKPVSKMELLSAVFPLTTRKFWFVNSYVALYLLSPYINKLIHSLSPKQLTALVVMLVGMFSVRPTVLPISWSQEPSGGMGVVWFVTLYCVAAWLRICFTHSIKVWKCMLLYLLATGTLVCSKRILLMLGLGDYSGKLYSYSSIIVLLQSVALFLAFVNSRPIAQKFGKIIRCAARRSYSVYVIHFAMWNVLFTNILHLHQCIHNPGVGFMAVFAATLGIYLFCIGVDSLKSFAENKIGSALAATRLGKKYVALLERCDCILNGR